MTRLTRIQRKERDRQLAEWLDSLRPDYEIRKAMVAARHRAGISQRELAERMQTSQSTIDRLERGGRSPNVKMLRRLAEATGSKLVIRLEEPATPEPNGAIPVEGTDRLPAAGNA